MIEYIVICNRCLKHEGHIESSKTKAWEFAKHDGWVKKIFGTKKKRYVEHICFNCFEKLEDEKAELKDAKRHGE